MRAEDEMAAVWGRYNALVVAVSIIFAALGFSDLGNKYGSEWVVGFAGLLVCIAWLVIHLKGYSNFSERLKKQCPNDEALKNRCHLTRGIYDWIFWSSVFVIIIFGYMFFRFIQVKS